MVRMRDRFLDEGYVVYNIDYPSTTMKTAALAEQHVRPKLASHDVERYRRTHFVTHSFGGIVFCYMQARDPFDNLGRVVMLSPPNQGSEVVDVFNSTWFFRLINGLAGRELGTGTGSLPNQLPPPTTRWA